jgi:hypothetical protein
MRDDADDNPTNESTATMSATRKKCLIDTEASRLIRPAMRLAEALAFTESYNATHAGPQCYEASVYRSTRYQGHVKER